MKTALKLFFFLYIIPAMIISGCAENKSTVEKLTSADSTINEEHIETAELTEAQVQAVGIQLGNVALKNLNDVVKASGQLAVPPQRQASVNVLIGGIIRHIYPLEGQLVKKGQPLVNIESTELAQTQEDYLTATNAFAFTAAELQRQKELDEAAAGTKKKYQEAQANYNVEMARISTLKQRLKQFGVNPSSVSKGNITTQMNINAPISGTIGHIAVNTGAYAQPGNSLMEIIDNSQIHCDLVVYEKDLFKVRRGQKVSFMLTNQDNRQIVGKIYGINKSFEDESKGIIVHAVIENANTYGLIPGMYVTALISIGSAQVTAVPADAVVRSEGKNYIFIVDEQESTDQNTKSNDNDAGNETDQKETSITRFRLMEVVTGISELGYIKITTPGEEIGSRKVVIKGANFILSKMKAVREEE